MGLVFSLSILYLLITLAALPKWPELAIGSQLFSKPIYAMAISQLGLPIGAAVLILVIVIAALFFYSLKERGQSVFPLSKIEIIFLVLVIWAFITLSYTASPNYGYAKMTELALIGVPCAISARVFGSSPARLEYTLKIVGVYAFCTLVILAAFVVLVGAGENSIRLQSRFFGPLGLGYSAATMTVVMLYLAFTGTFVVRLIVAFSMFYCVVVLLIASGSRGPVLGLLVAMALTFLRGKEILRTLSIAALVTFVGYFAVINYASEAGLARIQGDESSTRSNESRLYFLEVGVNQFASSPLLGQGVGSFSNYLSGVDRKQYPHNYPVEVAGELGLLGLAMYAGILALCIYSLIRVRRYVGNGGTVGYWAITVMQLLFYVGLVGSMFSGDISKQRVFYLGMGLLAGVSRWAWVEEKDVVNWATQESSRKANSLA